jgi:hypothetical protein
MRNLIKYYKKIKGWRFWILLNHLCETFNSKDKAPPMIKYSYLRQKMIQFEFKHYFWNLLKIYFWSYLITFFFWIKILLQNLDVKVASRIVFMCLATRIRDNKQQMWCSGKVQTYSWGQWFVPAWIDSETFNQCLRGSTFIKIWISLMVIIKSSTLGMCL